MNKPAKKTQRKAPEKKEGKRDGRKTAPPVIPELKNFHFDPAARTLKAIYGFGEHSFCLSISPAELALFLGAIPWQHLPGEETLDAFRETREALSGIQKPTE